jgi:hypothetical protein
MHRLVGTDTNSERRVGVRNKNKAIKYPRQTRHFKTVPVKKNIYYQYDPGFPANKKKKKE